MDLTSGAGCTSSPSSTAQALVGWVLESPGRGTLGLIFSCLSTTFLCTWVVIHARVYKRPLLHGLHKATLFFKIIIAPEFIAVEGLQEWSQARKMVKNCAGLTGGCLKLIHAFYIGMLALRYRTPRGEKVIWPNQYTWLLEQGLIDWDDHALWGLSEEDIRDKSNADGTAKLLALGQVSWFVAQSIMRRAHNLPLSQLETMTLSYIPLVAITYFFWFLKPKDIMTPSVVDLPDMLSGQKTAFEAMAVSSAFDTEGIGKQDSLWTIWNLTPRVFEKEAEDKALQEAQQQALQEAGQRATREAQGTLASPETKQAVARENENGENLKEERSAFLPGPSKASTKEIVVGYWDPELYHSKILWPGICLFAASFGALHLISWHTVFPTLLEQWLWRAAALLSIFSMLVFIHFEKVVLRWGGPLTMISLVSPMLYLLSRVVMLGGVIAAFRAADPAIYDTYIVSTYWIHIL
ncbi:MAG: hypothetical protein ALECFALPRED_008136 [Alectoria fallacina]|uniref:Uncharacterized protein n=1 Tax=Alectoria fallacina TaxID=1903189 RepID=A0A8H3I9K5_9LECA|nr:MAG: hypothetical protein ALECFALPRED_008136 [Alectoria fallacina]